MASGRVPYLGMQPTKAATEVLNGHRMEPPNECPIILADLMRDCWLADPNDRPTFQQILERLNNVPKYIDEPDLPNSQKRPNNNNNNNNNNLDT